MQLIRCSVCGFPSDYGFPDLAEAPTRPFLVGPKATMDTGRLDVGTDVLEDFRAGKLHIYFYGWAKYKDIFAEQHLTKFCSQVNKIDLIAPPGETRFAKDVADREAHIGMSWESCPEHNCYDEDCPDFSSKMKK